MLLRLRVMLIAAGLLLVGNVWADGPEIILVGEVTGAILLDGNASAPPPLVIVNGKVVVDSPQTGGPPDCSKAENRPICQALDFALGLEPCDGDPPGIIIWPDGKTVHFICNKLGDPPPEIVVNGECVNCR